MDRVNFMNHLVLYDCIFIWRWIYICSTISSWKSLKLVNCYKMFYSINSKYYTGLLLVGFWDWLCPIHNLKYYVFFFQNYFAIFHNFGKFNFKTSLFGVFLFSILAIMMPFSTFARSLALFIKWWEKALL